MVGESGSRVGGLVSGVRGCPSRGAAIECVVDMLVNDVSWLISINGESRIF